jgi:outer membrane protein OmpA-like peptidoglycan-associated protein
VIHRQQLQLISILDNDFQVVLFLSQSHFPKEPVMAVPDVKEVLSGKFRVGLLVNFRVSSSALLPRHQDWLDNVAAPHLLARGGARRVKLYGHASRSGSDEVNQTVAEARVLAVRQRLIAKGVSASQFDTDHPMGERGWEARGVPDNTENPEHRAVHVFMDS